MPDYQKLYTTMFNAATDALEELEHLNAGRAREILLDAQQRAEELYMGEDEDKADENGAGEDSTEEEVNAADNINAEKDTVEE